jgi:hypothetical protein
MNIVRFGSCEPSNGRFNLNNPVEKSSSYKNMVPFAKALKQVEFNQKDRITRKKIIIKVSSK